MWLHTSVGINWWSMHMLVVRPKCFFSFLFVHFFFFCVYFVYDNIINKYSSNRNIHWHYTVDGSIRVVQQNESRIFDGIRSVSVDSRSCVFCVIVLNASASWVDQWTITWPEVFPVRREVEGRVSEKATRVPRRLIQVSGSETDQQTTWWWPIICSHLLANFSV